MTYGFSLSLGLEIGEGTQMADGTYLEFDGELFHWNYGYIDKEADFNLLEGIK